MLTQLKQFYAELDAVAKEISSRYGDWHPCQKGCSTCCSHSIFLVSELEAAYIYSKLESVSKYRRREIAAKARHNLSAIHQRVGYGNWPRIVQSVKSETSLCPLLVDESCSLYEARPSVCRSYGLFIFPENLGVYGCPKVETTIKEHLSEGIQMPSFDWVAKRQAEVLKGRVMPVSAWLENI